MPGRPLAGATPEIVRTVHDKAFAFRFARENGYEARPLREIGGVWDPVDLTGDGAASRIREEVSSWPAWTAQRFTLKPRFGGAGRGRFGGSADTAQADIAAALPRLAERGGAILEPWVERTGDLSAQLYVAQDGTITLLGTLQQDVSGFRRLPRSPGTTRPSPSRLGRTRRGRRAARGGDRHRLRGACARLLRALRRRCLCVSRGTRRCVPARLRIQRPLYAGNDRAGLATARSRSRPRGARPDARRDAHVRVSARRDRAH